MPKVVPPGEYKGLKKGSVSRNRKQKPSEGRLNSVRACRERAARVLKAAEQGVISVQHAQALIRGYQAVTALILDEHELKLRGIRDKAPDDNSDKPVDDLVLGTHIKRRALVKRGVSKDGAPIEERSIVLEVSGPDPDALAMAVQEHGRFEQIEEEDIEDELAAALRSE